MQLSSLQYGAAAPASPLLSLAYSYGGIVNNGQIQGITDNVDSTRNTSYQYDRLGRLHLAQTVNQAASNSWQLTFNYDIYGNRLGETPTGGAGSMPSNYVTVDPTSNRIQGSGVLYDADGNMVSDGLDNYVFDANDRLVSTSAVPGLGGSPSTFSYGPDGGLVKRNATVYIYAAGELVAEYANGASAASPSIQYVNLGGTQLTSIASGTTTFNYMDHLSIRANADSAGNSVRTYGHFPFGETWYDTGTSNDFKFTSYRRDANSGLDYANARFYSSRLGRFTSADLVVGGNRYTYALNDPINLVDPTGLDAGTPCSLDPFHNFNLPLCGPDQLGNGVGSSNSTNCGFGFGTDGSFSFNIGSNCSSFNVSVGVGPVSNGGFETGIAGLPGGFTPGPPPLSCIPDIGSCDPPISALAGGGLATGFPHADPCAIPIFGSRSPFCNPVVAALFLRYCDKLSIALALGCAQGLLEEVTVGPPKFKIKTTVTAPNPDNDKGIDQLGNTARVMSNPCTYIAWTAASAAPYVVGRTAIAAANNAPTVIHGGLTWLNGLGAAPKPGIIAAGVATAQNAAKQAKRLCDAVN